MDLVCGEENWGHPDSQHRFLFDSLSPEFPELATENKYNLEQLEYSFFKRPVTKDKDLGPLKAWRWSFLESHDTLAYFAIDDHGYRRIAYVMWDESRLNKWGLLELDRTDLPSAVGYDREAVNIQSASFEARADIFSGGGRGWWEPGNLKYVVWTHSGRSSGGCRYAAPKESKPYWK